MLVVLVEQDALVGVADQPDVVAQLLLQLAGSPAGIAQRQHRLARAAHAAGHGVQHVAGGGQAQAVGHGQGRVR
jgi:hypothetical protein